MITWKQLSPALRTAVAAPWCVLAALAATAATPGGRQLWLDADHQPTAPVSLSSPNWIGTLDPARLPDAAAQYDPGGTLSDAGGNPVADAQGNRYVAGCLYTGAGLFVDGAGIVYAPSGLGVWGATPPGKQPDAIDNATDLASVIAGFNSLKTDLAAYGLLAPPPSSQTNNP